MITSVSQITLEAKEGGVAHHAVGALMSAVILTGCASGISRNPITPTAEPLNFSAPMDEVLTISTGEQLFATGTVAIVDVLEMSGPIKSTMPGSYGIPFAFEIDKAILQPRFQTDRHIYYCGQNDEVDASFPGLGRVVSGRDCVGVRAALSDGSYEWVVDNSYHNGSDTIWSRPVRPDDNVTFSKVAQPAPSLGGQLTEIDFDGFFDGKVHFTFRQMGGAQTKEDEFRFDVDENSPTVVGIKGYVFEVLAVDNVGLSYRWLKMPDLE